MEYWRLEYFLSFGFMNKFEKIEKSGILMELLHRTSF